MFIADFHIHSKYARACSKNLDLPNINAWCQLKGIDLISTADFTHPGWFKELNEQLEEVGVPKYQLTRTIAIINNVYDTRAKMMSRMGVLPTEVSKLKVEFDQDDPLGISRAIEIVRRREAEKKEKEEKEDE